MSVPINFNTTSLDELKTVLSKNKSQAVIKAREKFGHLSITAFRTATKLLTAQCQKMLNGGAMIYEVDTSAPILPEDTPPASEDIQIRSSILPPSTPIYLYCFSQSLGVAYEWTQHFQEVYLGISPIILHSPPAGMEEVVCCTPYDRLLLEMDSPCLGTSPAQLYHVAEKVQAWKKDDTSLENILLKGWQATLAFYCL